MRKLLLALAVLLALAGPTRAQMLTGFNQAWMDPGYGSDLTGSWDEAAWRRVFQRTRQGGGSVLRIWLFEGPNKEGVLWSGTRATGVDPAFLDHVRALIALAREHQVKVLWCVFDGNWFDHWGRGTVEHFRHFNILSNKYGEGDLFCSNALAPVVDLISGAADATYGLDLMNEVQGSVKTWMWSDGWAGCRRWIQRTAAFVHRRAAGLKVTASSGHHQAIDQVLDGKFDGLGLDFYDVHLYTDSGAIPRAAALVAHARARGVFVVLGEFGQSKTSVDAALQSRVAERCLAEARRAGFAAALAWRLEDSQATGEQFSFFEPDGRERPALAVMRRYGRPATATAAPAGGGLVGGLGR